MPSHSSAQRQTLDRVTVVLGHNGRPGPISSIVEEGSASARKLASAPRSTSSRQSHLIARSTVNQRRSIPPDRTKRPIGDKHHDGRGACSPMSAWSPLRAGQLTPDTRSIGLLNPLKNTTNTSHNELLHQDPLQPPLEPRPFPHYNEQRSQHRTICTAAMRG